MLQSWHSTGWQINRRQKIQKQYPKAHVQSKHHVNSRVDQACAKVLYRLNFFNFFMQGTSFIFIDVTLKFRYKPIGSNDFIDKTT